MQMQTLALEMSMLTKQACAGSAKQVVLVTFGGLKTWHRKTGIIIPILQTSKLRRSDLFMVSLANAIAGNKKNTPQLPLQ